MTKREKKQLKRQRKLAKQARKREAKAQKNQNRRESELKGENMFGFGSSGNKNTKSTTYYYGQAKDIVPATGEDSTTMSTVLFRQSVLDEIGSICLPAAGSSEFQVHYRSLQLIIDSKSGQRLVVTLPTVFFNMPQKVSTASVNFNLNNVAEISEKVAPISEAIAEKYLKAFPMELFENLGFTVEAREAEIGSMHRHPSNFGFSGIDLDNKAKNPGVIFRTREAEDRIQVDSVMYIPNKRVTLNTTETRVINVKSVDDGIEGSYIRVPTFSYILDDSSALVDFTEFFGNSAPVNELKFITDKDKSDKWYPQMEEIFGLFLERLEEAGEEFRQQLIIDPNLIEETYSYYKRGGAYGHGGAGRYSYPATHTTRTVPVRSTRSTLAKSYDVYDGDEFGGYGECEESDEYEVFDEYEELLEPEVTRSTLHKVQALGVLRSTYDIDVNHDSNIDGSGSVKDVKAIIKAMTAKGYDEDTIAAFFKEAAYTEDILKAAS